MSFCVWKERPPFRFEKNDAEQIYEIDGVFVITDQGPPTSQQVQAVVTAVPEKATTVSDLIDVLKAKGVISAVDLDAALKT